MNIIKKIAISALLSLSALGLTASLPALADGASDAARYCTVCHDGITVDGAVIGGGALLCPQRTTSEWITTIERMNRKGCGVPAGSIAGIASYLTCTGCMPTTTSSTSTSTTSTSSSTTIRSSTTTTWFERCTPMNRAYLSISPSSLSFVATQGGSLPVSQSLNVTVSNNNPSIYPYWQVKRAPTWLSLSSSPTGGGSSTVTASITSTQLAPGVYSDSIDFYAFTGCMLDTPALFVFPVTFTIDPSISTTSTTTVSSTTTTTLCNAYVNGTTQYKYSGSGSCHSFSLDLVTGAHIVRDQKYCRQHMTHFNSSGNHVHAYPHPACM